MSPFFEGVLYPRSDTVIPRLVGFFFGGGETILSERENGQFGSVLE